MNRQELEDYVIELYHNQKKTFREIQKIVRKSPRNIRAILDKVEPGRASLSESSRAYQMFNEGRNLIEVATALNLREKEVSQYYREYWNLNGMYYLNQIYEELREDIRSLVELHRRMKSESLSQRQIPRILKTTMTLEHNIRDLEGEQARLEFSNKEAAKTFQQFTDLKQKDCKRIEENEYIINQQKREIENLSIQKARLENNIDSIQHNDETCIKVKQAVTQVMKSVIPNPKKLLRIALASLFESERKNPGKLRALYYNKPSLSLSADQILPLSESISSSISPRELYGYDDEEEDAIAKLLLDETEQLFNRLVDTVTNRCINWMPNDKESSSQILPLPIIQDGRSNHEDLDTRNLSELNFVYNDITLQVFPTLKISNDQSSRTDTLPGEDELDNTSFLDQE
ncbi:MAG TPA: hypothetical protein VE544_12265 [Nitrososphaeraceae archaeon]|nr:hypothetical protein [Nitrososphaeraceae archaeon]